MYVCMHACMHAFLRAAGSRRWDPSSNTLEDLSSYGG